VHGDFVIDGRTAANSGVRTLRGRYVLRGAARNAPREAEFAFSVPDMWLARSPAEHLWLSNPQGFYFDFDPGSGPYFVPANEPVVYRNPVPELFALESLEACRSWLARTGAPPEGRPSDLAGRAVQVYDSRDEWGVCSISVDVETGAVLRVSCDGRRGRLELLVSGFEATEGVSPGEFGWRGPTRNYTA